MPNNSAGGGCVWRALAEFLCAISPEQFILLPTLLASNIFYTTTTDEQNLIANFFSVLGQSLSAITSQGEICQAARKADLSGTNGTNGKRDDSAQSDEESTGDADSIVRTQGAQSGAAHTLIFE